MTHMCYQYNMHTFFEKFADKFAELVGSSWAFVMAMFLGFVWLSMLGREEVFGVQRVALVEFAAMFLFLQLFLLQRTQNKNLKALHLKLDELIASKDGADNHLIKAERASEDDIEDLRSKYVNLADSKKNSKDAVSLDTAIEKKSA